MKKINQGNQFGIMRKHFLAIWILVLTVVLFAACNANPVPQTTPAVPTQVDATQAQAEATNTPEPSPTPQPEKALLVAPEGSDSQAVRAALAELSDQAGLVFETRAAVQPGEVTQEYRVVILLAAPENLNELVNAAPQAQFLLLAGGETSPAGNLSVIRQRPEDQTFLAGYIAVLLSNDWRAAGLLPADGPLGAELKNAYINGGRYFCGTCAPGWPLGVYYPQAVELSASSDGPTWQAAAADQFDNQKAEVFFLTGEALKPEVIDYLAGREQFGKMLVLLGTQSPPDALREQWAATVRFDLVEPVKQVWPDLLAGEGGAVLDAALVLDEVNSQLLSQGRMRLIEELQAEMQAGRISPLSVPLE